MLHQNADNLDALIHEEKRRVAVEFFLEAWNSAQEEGIEASILAESAIEAILVQLDSVDGTDAVQKIIESLPRRAESGHFMADRTLQ